MTRTRTFVAVLVLAAAIAAGRTTALAVSAPLASDLRDDTADPVLPPVPGTAAPPPEKPAVGNPLWVVPLSDLAATRQRPLFAPSRRPPSPVVAAPPPQAPRVAPPPPPAPPEKPQLSLVGTIAGSDTVGIGIFVDQATRTVLRLKVGEEHKGWILRAVQLREVALEKGLEKELIALPPPDMKASGAPAPAVLPPPGAGPPAVPPRPPSGAAPPPNVTGTSGPGGRPPGPPPARSPEAAPAGPPAVDSGSNPFKANWLKDLQSR